MACDEGLAPPNSEGAISRCRGLARDARRSPNAHSTTSSLENLMLTRKQFLKFSLAVASPVWAPRSMGDEGVARLGPPSRVTSLPVKLHFNMFPYSDKGFFLQFDLRETFPDSLPNVGLYRLDGNPVYETKVVLPGSSQTQIRHLAVKEDGAGLVCGKAIHQDGGVAPFIALLDSAGNLTRVIRTNPFQPDRACFGPDGTIWALGVNEEARDRAVDAEIFEHYSAEGKLLGKMVLRSSIPEGPLFGQWDLQWMRASEDRIGAWITYPSHLWIELSADDGRLLGMWRTLLPVTYPNELGAVFGIAYTPEGAVCGNFGNQQLAALWWLDRSKSSWAPVPEFSMSQGKSGVGGLLGRDGDQLVFHALDGNLLFLYPLPPTPAGALPTEATDTGYIQV